jgi:hypothetical protein
LPTSVLINTFQKKETPKSIWIQLGFVQWRTFFSLCAKWVQKNFN